MKEKEKILEYASLVQEKLKIGEDDITFNSDRLSEIDLKMFEIRRELNSGHVRILIQATEILK